MQLEIPTAAQKDTQVKQSWKLSSWTVLALVGLTASSGTAQEFAPELDPAATVETEQNRSDGQAGFKPLFDGRSFAGWQQAGNWAIDEGAFHRTEQGGPLTYIKSKVPDNFELRFEWRVSPGCNSGIYYRPGQVEYQILDNQGSPYGENPRQAAGSLFFCMAPSKDVTRAVEEWNSGRIVCHGTVIQHWMNGEKIIDFDYTDPKWEDQVELLEIRGGDLTARGGRLWLQDHGHEVWFRNLWWRELPEDKELKPDEDFEPMPIPEEALAKERARVTRMLDAKE